MPLDQHVRIAVIGAGAMGAGIAQVAAASGHEVVVIDRDVAALERGRAAIGASLATLVRKGRMSSADQAATETRIGWTRQLADAASCGLAIEAIVERLDAKRALFAALASIMSDDAILASNTSSLAIRDIAADVSRPHRILGLHFFNPVPLMKLVEVIAAPGTDPGVVGDAMALMRTWGKHPVAVGDVPGFIVNRVARPYYAEAFAALDEGLPPTTIDRALTASGGFRMGPLTLADMIGHDVNFAVANTVYDAYAGKTRFRPQPAQRALVETGALGRKTGGGVYRYDAPPPQPDTAPPASPPKIVRLAAGAGLLADLCRAAGLPFEIGIPDGSDAIVDGIRIGYGDGRPLLDRPDIDVLVDAVRTVDTATTIVLAARAAETALPVIGLVQASGREALLVPDRPGLIVLRILAQLANAAADAVADGIANAEGIDAAMVHGANHPEGPLRWAHRTGLGRVAAMLRNIAAATGDAMYRPAELFIAAQRQRDDILAIDLPEA